MQSQYTWVDCCDLQSSLRFLEMQGITHKKQIAHLSSWASQFYNHLPNHKISFSAATCIYLILKCVQCHLPTWASKIDLCLPSGNYHLPTWASKIDLCLPSGNYHLPTWASKIDLCLPSGNYHLPTWASKIDLCLPSGNYHLPTWASKIDLCLSSGIYHLPTWASKIDLCLPSGNFHLPQANGQVDLYCPRKWLFYFCGLLTGPGCWCEPTREECSSLGHHGPVSNPRQR